MLKFDSYAEENSLIAIVALVLGAIAISASPIFVRLSETGPIASAFWRVGLALPFFFLFFWQEKRRNGVPFFNWQQFRWFVLSGFLFAADLAFWHWSIGFTTVANATLLSNLMTIVVALGSYYLFGEHLDRLFFVGLAVALVGVTLLTSASATIFTGRIEGDILGIITAIFYGAFMLSIRFMRRECSTWTIMFFTGMTSAIFLLPLAVLIGEKIIPETIMGWGYLLGLSFISQVLGQSLITFAFKHLPAAFGAITLLIQPMLAAAIAWPLFGEVLTVWDFAAGLLILVGIVLARISTRA